MTSEKEFLSATRLSLMSEADDPIRQLLNQIPSEDPSNRALRTARVVLRELMNNSGLSVEAHLGIISAAYGVVSEALGLELEFIEGRS